MRLISIKSDKNNPAVTVNSGPPSPTIKLLGDCTLVVTGCSNILQEIKSASVKSEVN